MRHSGTGKFLICNADDFGASEAITDAILQSHRSGIITSTTLMSNMPGAEYACRKAKETPDLGVGVHLTLTAGKSVCPREEVPDLVDDNGRFLSSTILPSRLWRGKEIYRQVEREFTAQVEKAIGWGIQPTHCDSHHHIARFPVTLRAMVRVARNFGIRAVRTNFGYYQYLPGSGAGNRLRSFAENLRRGPRIFRWGINHVILRYWYRMDVPDRKIVRGWIVPRHGDPGQTLIETLAALPAGVTELSFHPGLGNPEPGVDENPAFSQTRLTDFRLTTDPLVRDVISRYKITLVSYRYFTPDAARRGL